MSDGLQTAYYARRERQERERAEAASDEAARRVHQEMAKRYSALMAEREPNSSAMPLRG